MNAYYFCGLTVDKDTDHPHFELVRPTGCVPYVTKEQDDRAMRLCEHHSALYAFHPKDNFLKNTNDIHYVAEEPQIVEISNKLKSEIQQAIEHAYSKEEAVKAFPTPDTRIFCSSKEGLNAVCLHLDQQGYCWIAGRRAKEKGLIHAPVALVIHDGELYYSLPSIYDSEQKKQAFIDSCEDAVHWLWEEFGDVPMNPETERMEAQFLDFPYGTHREDIWHYFEEELGADVSELMYGKEDYQCNVAERSLERE